MSTVERATGIDLQPEVSDRGDQTVCSLAGEHRGELVIVELIRDCGHPERAAKSSLDQLSDMELRRGASWSLERWNARAPATSTTCAYEVEGTSISGSTTTALLTMAVHSDSAPV